MSSSCSSASDNSLRAKRTISSWVSRWERQNVAERLHLFYRDDYMTNYLDIYGQMDMAGLDEQQRLHFEKVKGFLSPINTSLRDMKYFPEVFLSVIEQISAHLVNTESDELIKRIVSEFLKTLIDLTIKTKERKSYEGGYTRLLDRFAFMCGLHTRVSLSKDDQVIWPKLTGIKNVISKPDLRLFKHGVTTGIESLNGSMLASVVSVKKGLAKDVNELELQVQKLEESTHLSSSCSFLEDYSESKDKIPIIEYDLDRNILGQHAGELLLDLYQFHRDVEVPVMRMSGIIVNETEVFLTMLEISKEHFRKLEKNEDLDQEDKATIYYSKPLDILVENERNTLMEILIRLNNLENNT